MHIIEIIRWIAGIASLLLFTWIAIAHAVFLIQFYAGRVKSGSMLLIVNGLLGVAGILLIPVDRFHRWWWLPFFLDVGAGPVALVVGGVHWIFIGRRSKNDKVVIRKKWHQPTPVPYDDHASSDAIKSNEK